MGVTKIGLSLVERCAKYAEACGKKSILQTVPQDLFKANLKVVKYAPKSEGDIVQFSKNNYLANIKKLGLNEQDSEKLKRILSGYHSILDKEYFSELQRKFNEIINNPNTNLEELRELLSGKETVNHFGKIWRNTALDSESKWFVILEKLKSMSPKDLKIIKKCNEDVLNDLYDEGGFVLPDKHIKQLSELLKQDDIYITKGYSHKLNKFGIIEGYSDTRTYFTYDRKKGTLVFFDKDGTPKLIQERIVLKDIEENPTHFLKYEQSDIDGVYNVLEKDLKTGKVTPLSEAFIDETGKKVVTQNLCSPAGTKSQVHYEEMPNGASQYNYTILDKKGNILFKQVRSRSVLNDAEFKYSINEKTYNVKFVGTDKIEILQPNASKVVTIDLKTLLSELQDTEKTEIISMLKKVPADELFALKEKGIKQIINGKIQSSHTLGGASSITTMPNEFVFLHELGHQKDLPKLNLSAIDEEYLNRYSENMGKTLEGNWDFIDNIKPLSNGDNFDAWHIIDLEDKIKKASILQISSDEKLLKIYNKERAAFIEKFGDDDERIDYFIRQGSDLGCEGEAIAEINALLSTPISASELGTRSYLLTENFPETIAYASKLLLKH